jgi:RNA polymerase sigma factor (sigma-70 family)
MQRQQTRRSGLGRLRSEATLFDQAQGGCRTSLDQLMIRHEGLVQAVVRQQVLGNLPFAEALHAGRIGLWKAILGFDPARGWAFSTYAWPAIKHWVWRAVKSDSRAAHTPQVLSPDDSPADGTNPVLSWEEVAVQQALIELVQRLPPHLRYVIVARYGLDGHPPAFFRQIGAALGLSREWARQLYTEALVWLRHPAHSWALRSLLDRHTLQDYEAADALAQAWLRKRGGRHGRNQSS